MELHEQGTSEASMLSERCLMNWRTEGCCPLNWALSGWGLSKLNCPVMFTEVSAHLKRESLACFDWCVTLAWSLHLLCHQLVVSWIADYRHSGMVLSCSTEESNTTCTGSGLSSHKLCVHSTYRKHQQNKKGSSGCPAHQCQSAPLRRPQSHSGTRQSSQKDKGYTRPLWKKTKTQDMG